MDGADARELWMRFEPVHAVTFFAPECRQSMKDLGYRGFWMGYFAGRGAPLGRVGPAVVGALFYNFAPEMVQRSLPAAWELAHPPAALAARVGAASAVLRSLGDHVDGVAQGLAPLLCRVVENAEEAGRPLFGANRELGFPEDPVAALWQACTCLREHRGDGHVAQLVASGLDGLEAHVLSCELKGTPTEVIAPNRGWSEEAWVEARARLSARGLLEGAGPTAAGRALHQSLETATDTLAAPVWDVLADAEMGRVIAGLGALAQGVISSGMLGFPNPIGLPRLGGTELGGEAG
jgi:hypothetical protein